MANERGIIANPNVVDPTIAQQLGMQAESVIVDNTTGQWWTIGGTDRRIPPYTTGIVIRLPNGTQVANIQAQTPPSFTSAPRVGETALFVFSDSVQREDSGRPVQPTPLPGGGVTGTPASGTGTIAVAATAQTVFAANPSRRYLLIQNRSLDVMAVQITGAAAVQATSIALNPAPAAGQGGGSLEFDGSGFVPTTLISIIAPTLGSQFVAYQG